MDSKQLLELAETLTQATGGRPRQVALRRAVSTAYYAMFHSLTKDIAECLVGKTLRTRPDSAWRQVYRGLDHKGAKTACNNRSNAGSGFPVEIQDFATSFVQLQVQRHAADYDPYRHFSKQEVLDLIAEAEAAIA